MRTSPVNAGTSSAQGASYRFNVRAEPISPYELISDGSETVSGQNGNKLPFFPAQTLNGEAGQCTTSLVGESSAIKATRHIISRAASTDYSVFITGETGTGKELVAHDIHENSSRKNKPFIAINCAALPEETIESILFGHKKGAFTDAYLTTKGLFEEADGGTIFLDEVGELSLKLQSKLNRVLENGEVEKVGGSTTKVNVRVIAATNCKIEEKLKEGKFREDLYYRLNVIPIQLTPLRERPEDIEPIAEHFLLKNSTFVPDKLVTGFTQEAMLKLKGYKFPGNVRELENIIRRAIVFAKGGVIEDEDIVFITSEASRKAQEHIDDISISNAHVLILGETGTGKELKAKEIHKKSGRNDGPFVVVNCSTLRKDLAESQLFGHVKGAFTGAFSNHTGYFENANGGTLFLDEVQDLDYNIQTKLLRAIQQKEITPMGSNKSIRVNVRIIATSNKSLEEAVKKGAFRDDLYYRLSVIPIGLLPLRERRHEIPELALGFLSQANQTNRKKVAGISVPAIEKLASYDWPGNVRELKTTIERAFVFTDDGKLIEPESISFLFSTSEDRSKQKSALHPFLQRHLDIFLTYISSASQINEDDAKFLLLKYRIAKNLISSMSCDLTTSSLAKEYGSSRSSLDNLCQRYGYQPASKLISELKQELTRHKGNGHSDNNTLITASNEKSSLHPFLQKYLNMFIGYANSSSPINSNYARLLVIKCRIARALTTPGLKNVTTSSLATDFGVERNTMMKWCKSFGYESACELTADLEYELKEYERSQLT